MSRFVGLKGSDPAPEPAGAQKKKSAPAAKSTQTAAATPKAPAPKSGGSAGPALSGTGSAVTTTNAGAIRPAAPKAEPQEAKPEGTQEAKAPAAAEQRPANSAGLLNGAQPTMPTGSFNSRWGSF